MIGLPTLEEMVVQHDATLKDALSVIDANSQGMCFVVDNGRVIGVLSDGDIRRALIKDVDMNIIVSRLINEDFISLPTNTPLEDIQAQLNEKVKIIPIVDKDGCLVDYACENRYHQVPLTQPILDGNELEYVTDCIRTGWISSQGKYVKLFEKSFGEYVGVPNTLAVSNGTVALHLALVTLGIGPGDEVLVPNLTFASPLNAILYVGATPVLVDVNLESMAIDVELAESMINEKTRAILPVHLYGHPANMRAVMNLAHKYDLLVVEDCAEALGSLYENSHVGKHGDAAIFSFFGNKTITTGEGGMLLFKDVEKYKHAQILRDHGMSREKRYWHDEVGFNYRMTNIQAAVGVAQLERINEFVEKKRWIAELYNQKLSAIEGIQLPGECGDVTNSYWLFTVVLPNDLLLERDKVLNLMGQNGIEVRPVFFPIHRMPPYSNYVKQGQNFANSDRLSDLGVCLPSAVNMTEADIKKVCLVLTTVIENIRNEKRAN